MICQFICEKSELDFEEVLKWKMEKLATVNAPLKCAKHETIACDLTKDNWENLLIQRGFDLNKPALFIIEGLIMYLTKEENFNMLSRISAISAPGSIFSGDALSPQTLYYSNLTLNKIGCPAKLGLQNPNELFPNTGWLDAGSVDLMEEKRNRTMKWLRGWVPPYWMLIGRKQLL